MNKISPGKWHRGTGNGEGSIFADTGRMRMEEGGTTLYPICKMIKGWNPEEDEANEIAIAALPDLLTLFEGFLRTMDDVMGGGDTVARYRDQYQELTGRKVCIIGDGIMADGLD